MPDGVRIHCESWGRPLGKSVVLSHGGGQTRHAWGKTASCLADCGWLALTYDYRGHGESGWSPDGHYSRERFALDLTCVAEWLPDRPVAIGASLGGVSAILAEGESAKGIFSALVLVDIVPRVKLEGARNVVRFMEENMRIGFASIEEAGDAVAQYTGRARRGDVSGLLKELRIGA